MARRRARPEHVNSIFNPPDYFQGRVGAMRIKNSIIDSTPIVAYFPAGPATASKMKVAKGNLQVDTDNSAHTAASNDARFGC